METVTVHDLDPRGFLAFDLRHILSCLGHEAARRQWTCKNLECTGAAAEQLEVLADAGQIDGVRLALLSARALQVIWGDFLGYCAGEDRPSLVIKAIDSSFWQISGDTVCVARIRSEFGDVRPAGYDAS